MLSNVNISRLIAVNSSLLCNSMMDIHAIRHARLEELLRGYSRLKEFADAVATEPSIISAIKNGARNMGNDVARRIEGRLGLGTGYMDRIPTPMAAEPRAGYELIPKFDARLSAGHGAISTHHEEIQSTIAFRRDWLVAHGLNIPALVAAEASGDSMSPRIEHGDALLIDTSDRAIKNGRIYAFRVGDDMRVKRFFLRIDGSIVISSDNKSPEYPDEDVPQGRAEQLAVLGRVVWSGGAL